MYDWIALFAVILLGVPLLLLAFGLASTSVWIAHGGLVQNLARVLLDPARGRRFILLFSVVLVSFLSLGTFFAIGILLQSFGDTLQIAVSLSFLLGCTGLFLMMVNGLPRAEMNLSDELRLRSSYPGAADALDAGAPAGSGRPRESMYVLPPRAPRPSDVGPP